VGAGSLVYVLEDELAVRTELIGLDMRMPRIDGFTFLSPLRRKPAAKRMPIIVVVATLLRYAASVLARDPRPGARPAKP
jgi:CheY-like chemotaxis protein